MTTHGFYCIPVPNKQDGFAWQILKFEEVTSYVWNGHKEVFPDVLSFLAQIWGLDSNSTVEKIAKFYQALPRGRCYPRDEKTSEVLIGFDTPVDDGASQLEKAFNVDLSEIRCVPSYWMDEAHCVEFQKTFGEFNLLNLCNRTESNKTSRSQTGSVKCIS